MLPFSRKCFLKVLFIQFLFLGVHICVAGGEHDSESCPKLSLSALLGTGLTRMYVGVFFQTLYWSYKRNICST